MQTTLISPRQDDYLSAIKDLIAIHGVSPTYEEIAEFVGVSKPAAAKMVRTLVRLGYLRQPKSRRSRFARWRAIRPTQKAFEKIAA